jgi:hypothetical protein
MAFSPRVNRPLGIDLTRPVRVFNRTSRVLDVRCDGRIFPLQPGENQIPAVVVPYAQRQHPRLGTWEKGAIYGESLVGVIGMTPDEQMTPLLEGHEHLGNEHIDRQAHPFERPMRHEPMASARTMVDIGVNDAVRRSSLISTNDNGPLPAPTLQGAEIE